MRSIESRPVEIALKQVLVEWVDMVGNSIFILTCENLHKHTRNTYESALILSEIRSHSIYCRAVGRLNHSSVTAPPRRCVCFV